MRKSTAAPALLLAAALSAPGVAHAQPTDEGVVNYTATSTGQNTVIRTDAGSMTVEDGVFRIRAADGTTVAGTELSFRVDEFVFPIAADISGRTATLTPRFDLAHARYEPVALPFENSAPWKTEYEREQAAWSRMTSTISMGATIGTLAGGLAGGAAGCLIGGVAGATLTGALSAMFGALPGAIVGCIAGMSAIGFLGTLAGQIFVTAPVAILAAAQYFTTINQPAPAPQAK
ncbi:hypothetical protein [Nocardia sp. IFM 10818]